MESGTVEQTLSIHIDLLEWMGCCRTLLALRIPCHCIDVEL